MPSKAYHMIMLAFTRCESAINKGIVVRAFKIIFFFLFLSTPFQEAHTKLIQILHTNDIHSYFDHVEHRRDIGGYAALKALIEKEKRNANQEQIPTLVVDAGDFSEGNMYYMADKGRHSFKLHDSIGYDLVTVGNHDYLMGTKDLDNILKDVNPNFKFLGANISVDKKYKNISKHLAPFKEFNINGIKLGFVGLTTNEMIFKWRLNDGKITSPYSKGKEFARLMKKRGNHAVIALTHIGLKRDKKLAKRAKDFDLIIGGHSHDALYKPVFSNNIPIVQAGNHAKYLGKLIVDVSPNGGLKIISYKLIPVLRNEMDNDTQILIDKAKEDLYHHYGRDWLEEPLGESELKKVMEKESIEAWGFFISRSMKEALGADVGIHAQGFSGEDYPLDNISRWDLYNSFPRSFNLQNKMGWHVYTAKVRGVWLKLLFKVMVKFNLPLYLSGITFKHKKNKDGTLKVWDLKIKGKKIKWYKNYKIAMPEGLGRGAKEISPLTGLLLKKNRSTSHYIWSVLSKKVQDQFFIGFDENPFHYQMTFNPK